MAPTAAQSTKNDPINFVRDMNVDHIIYSFISITIFQHMFIYFGSE